MIVDSCFLLLELLLKLSVSKYYVSGTTATTETTLQLRIHYVDYSISKTVEDPPGQYLSCNE